MRLNNKTYDWLKWLTLICLPALGAAYSDLAGIWGWPLAEQVARTVTHLCALLGALLGVSTAEYRKGER